MILADFLKYDFLRNALIGGILASILCGIIGTIIIEKKLVMMSGGIAHASLGGIGIAHYFNFDYLIGALSFSFLSSLVISASRKNEKAYTDTIIGMIWSFSMAIGLLFIYLKPGFPPDINGFLFGDILTVSNSNLNFIAFSLVVTLVVILSQFNYWKYFLFDEEYASVLGINVERYTLILFALISLAIVALIKLAGIILIIALLTIPPMLAKLFFNKFSLVMMASVLVSILFIILGLLVSYSLNIPSGITIIIISSASFFIAKLIKTKSLF